LDADRGYTKMHGQPNIKIQKSVSTANYVSKQINCQYNFPVVCAYTCVYVHVKNFYNASDWDMPKSFV